MQGEKTGRSSPAERALWHKSRMTEAADDEAARLLDLAAFAEGRLDPDDRERVAEWLAADPEAAADVAAAMSAARGPTAEALPESVVARACALVEGGPPRGAVIAFARRPTLRRPLPGMARWASLVAAVAVASWLGFTLGVDTSQSLAPSASAGSQAGQRGVLQELLDPSMGSLRDLTGGTQT